MYKAASQIKYKMRNTVRSDNKNIWDLRFWRRLRCRHRSSELWRRSSLWVGTNVSEGYAASIYMPDGINIRFPTCWLWRSIPIPATLAISAWLLICSEVYHFEPRPVCLGPHRCKLPRLTYACASTLIKSPTSCQRKEQSDFRMKKKPVIHTSLNSKIYRLNKMYFVTIKLLIMHFLQLPLTSTLLDPNILLSTPFSKTQTLCSSLNTTSQVSSPHKTMDTIIVL